MVRRVSCCLAIIPQPCGAESSGQTVSKSTRAPVHSGPAAPGASAPRRPRLPPGSDARRPEPEPMHKLVLLRHGESNWNRENRFTGWTDVDLSDEGRRGGARRPASCCKQEGYTFDVAYTSVLKRAIRTLWIALDEMDLMWIPVATQLAAQRAALRRAAGPEQGRDGGEVRRGAGQDLAAQLRHPAAAARAATTRASPAHDPRYARPVAGGAAAHRMPQGHGRALPARTGTSASRPRSQAGKRVLIAAHGNSLRALVKYLDDVSDEEIVGLNIPTGIPLVYELDDDLKPRSGTTTSATRQSRSRHRSRRRPGQETRLTPRASRRAPIRIRAENVGPDLTLSGISPLDPVPAQGVVKARAAGCRSGARQVRPGQGQPQTGRT